MTLEKYIETLEEAQGTLEIVISDLDRAILRARRGEYTGSHAAALAGRELMRLASSSIYEASTTPIDN